MARSEPGPIRVSVVVPVYNPGSSLEICVASLLRQTLPPAARELIFVDDGSTDGSPERLRQLADQHPDVRLIGIPRSGWPGKPRNVGTDAARGEYIMYVDQDDALEPDALRRMYRLGSASGADVVLGKVISDFRGVHHNLYRKNVARCTVWDAPLINSQTPHKMLRTAFLRQTGIRYPEGPRRLEDQLFITRAYFAATSAAIVGDYVCYRYLRRSDGENAGDTPIDPPSYYANLREVLDVVDRHTEPGPVRDGFYRRFVRTEMLGRLAGRKLAETSPDDQQELLAEVRALLAERVPESVDAGLGAALRVRAGLARAGTLADLVGLESELAELTLEVRRTSVRIGPESDFLLDVELSLSYRGEPLALEPGTDGQWLLPRGLTGTAVPDEQRRVEPPTEWRGDVVVRHRKRLDEWFLPAPLIARVEPGTGVPRWTGTVRLDPAAAAGGRALRSGRHELIARVEAFGLTRNAHLRKPHEEPPPWLVEGTGRGHRLLVRPSGLLVVQARVKPSRWAGVLRESVVRVAADGEVTVTLPAVWQQPPALRLVLVEAPGNQPYETELHPTEVTSPVWSAPPGWGDRLPAGTYQAVLERPGTRRLELEGTVVVERSRAENFRRGARRARDSLRGTVESRVREPRR